MLVAVQPNSSRQTGAPVVASYAPSVGPGPNGGAPAMTTWPAAKTIADSSPSRKSGTANPAIGAPVRRSKASISLGPTGPSSGESVGHVDRLRRRRQARDEPAGREHGVERERLSSARVHRGEPVAPGTADRGDAAEEHGVAVAQVREVRTVAGRQRRAGAALPLQAPRARRRAPCNRARPAEAAAAPAARASARSDPGGAAARDRGGRGRGCQRDARAPSSSRRSSRGDYLTDRRAVGRS